MTSLAWSSLALLVLLLPGLLFLAGLYIPERFARDVTPRNPLVGLAATVLVSLLIHATLSTGLRLGPSSWAVDWAAVLDAVQMAPPSVADRVGAAVRAGRRFEDQGPAIVLYVLASSAAGGLLGWLSGLLVVRGYFHAIAVQHPWTYPLQPGRGGAMTYAHVLTNIGPADKPVLYRGRLKHFALAADGSFDYVVLAATGQRFLRLDGDVPRLGEIREIGEERVHVPGPEPAPDALLKQFGAWIAHPINSWHQRQEHRRKEAFRRAAEARAADKALMVIPAATIRDVVFQGLYQIPHLKSARKRARELRKAASQGGDERAQLEALRAFRAGGNPSIGVALSTQDVQRALVELGFDPGRVDGVLGSRTRKAVRSFQTIHGLHPDGDAGPITSARLHAERERQRAQPSAGGSKLPLGS